MNNDDRWVAALDVGSTGRDPSVLCLRRGCVLVEFLRFNEADVLKTATLVDAALRSRGFRPSAPSPDAPLDLLGGGRWDEGLTASSDLRTLVIDVIGVGDGCARWLEAAGWPVLRFRSSDRARDAVRYDNARAEGHWLLREALELGTIAAARCEALAEEIVAARWTTNLRTGRILIERKDELRKRLGRSPDHLDAAAMTFAADGAGSIGGAMVDF